MKKCAKTIFFISAILMLILGLSLTASAETEGYYTYEVADGKAIITDVDTSISGDITIPSTLGGYPVTSIGIWAFEYCSSLQSVTIPNSVTSIGDYAFRYCSSLQSITIPDSVTSIGYCAFYECSSLQSITIPDSVTSIGYGAFGYCRSLESITIPDSVLSIGRSAFEGCTGLTSITLPFVGASKDEIRNTNFGYIFGAEIPDHHEGEMEYHVNYYCVPKNLKEVIITAPCEKIASAFIDCTNIVSITIPDSVTSIGSFAFSGCTNLTNITIPDSVTSIGSNAFDCTEYYNNEVAWEDGILYIGDFLIKADKSITSCNIRQNTKIICGLAFSDCDSLTNIIIPEGVKGISDDAFNYCNNLTDITVHKNNAFYSSENGVLFDKNKTEIKKYPEGKGLTTYSIPESITSIGSYAFYYCKELTSIAVPDGVTSIEDYAFYGCTGFTNITIPDSVTSIGDYAFYSCRGLTNITIPDSVTSIGESAFDYCSSLQSIIIPNSVTSIGEAAFEGCASLTSIKIPNSVTSIGDYAFYYCKELTSITLPASLNYFDFLLYECPKLESIIIDENNPYYSSIDGVVFDKDKTTLVIFPEGKSSTPYIIPEGVTSIGEFAFEGCTSLTSITIPEGVTSIGESAFEGCTSLTSIKIADSVTSIIYRAFEGCTSLTNITIPDSVTFIGTEAFRGCKNLKSIIIPNGIKKIRSNTFYDCKSLKEVCFTGTKKQWNKISIENGNENLTTAAIQFDYHEHVYSPSYTVDKKATCTSAGSKSKHCTRSGCTEKISVTAIAKTAHKYKTTTTKATLAKNGKVVTKCSSCGYISKTTTIYRPEVFKLSKAEFTYNGKMQTPSVIVRDSKEKALKKDTDYTVSYEKGRKVPGEYTVKITFKGKYEGIHRLYFTIKPRATSKVTATSTTTTITLKWNKVTGAEGYRIYQYNTKTKKYEKVKDVTGTSLKISKLKAGTKYKFKVRAFTKDDGTIMGAYSSIFETATKAKTPSITKISTTKGKASLTWSNVTGESGYQIYYATKKNGEFKKVDSYKVNVVKGSKSKLTSGKTYYFKVRAYTKTDSGTVYSAWSTVKSVKVK